MCDKQVVVVVPVYHFPLSREEEISVRHLLHFLGNHDLSLAAPQSLEITDPRLRSLLAARPDLTTSTFL